ncbi:MAG: hypothetical protein LBU32_13865 [Clostridiales bacterium]|jgi:hypothetical protein|nr:hypothetical protein [Clostridiales bacterium]
MEGILEISRGLGVRKETAAACIMEGKSAPESTGGAKPPVSMEIKAFGTPQDDLSRLKSRILEEGRHGGRGRALASSMRCA